MFQPRVYIAGWGSIEYGAPQVAGQVPGGRLKPLHYQLARSTFADHMAACNTAGACWVTNDAPFAFEGTVSLRLLNTVSGDSTAMKNHSALLGPGAGVTHWFCAAAAATGAGATQASTVAVGSRPAVKEDPKPYARHRGQLPFNRTRYYATLGSKTNVTTECEARCSSNATCVGFTRDDQEDTRCWLYGAVGSLVNHPGFSFYQKPGTQPLPPVPPLPPAPAPPPTPPPQLTCSAYKDTPAWQGLSCAASNCVLIAEVTDTTTGALKSHNVMPFAAPKSMALPAANVTASVGDLEGRAAGGLVPITLHTTGTALYVVLTTAAAGRFSDNAVLLERGETKTIDFVAWPVLDAAGLALLKSSLRVEHLADNL